MFGKRYRGQGKDKEEAIKKLKEAIESFNMIYESETDIDHTTVSIKELHEFLTIEEREPFMESYELKAIHA